MARIPRGEDELKCLKSIHRCQEILWRNFNIPSAFGLYNMKTNPPSIQWSGAPNITAKCREEVSRDPGFIEEMERDAYQRLLPTDMGPHQDPKLAYFRWRAEQPPARLPLPVERMVLKELKPYIVKELVREQMKVGTRTRIVYSHPDFRVDWWDHATWDWSKVRSLKLRVNNEGFLTEFLRRAVIRCLEHYNITPEEHILPYDPAAVAKRRKRKEGAAAGARNTDGVGRGPPSPTRPSSDEEDDDDGEDGDDSDDDGGDEDNAGAVEDQVDAEEPLQHQGEAGDPEEPRDQPLQHQGAEAGSGAGSRAVLGQRDLSTTQPLPSQPPIDRWRYVRPPPGGKNRYIS